MLINLLIIIIIVIEPGIVGQDELESGLSDEALATPQHHGGHDGHRHHHHHQLSPSSLTNVNYHGSFSSPQNNCSFHEDDIYCDCDYSIGEFKCFNIESSQDIRFALNYLLNLTNKYYWSQLEINCIEPYSKGSSYTSLNSFHIETDLFISGPKFKSIKFIGDCSKPKHYDNLLHVEKDLESIFMAKNSLRMTTTCSLLQPKLERLFELTIIDSLFAGDMISATFSTRCLGQYGTRNEPLPLTKLTIRSSNITLIESGAFLNFAELQLIDLSNNQLTHLSRQVFAQKIYKIRFIYLQNNRITQLSSDFFEGLPQLRSVNLAGNLLTILPYIPTGTGIPQNIFLEGNLWDCRCKMDWIILEKLIEGNQRYFDEPQCTSPEQVKDFPLFDGLRFVYETFC